jgi:ribosomal protein L11 methyltransferase
VHSPGEVPAANADLVVANILAGPLQALADTLLGTLAPGGHLVLAGLLEGQAAELITRYAPAVALVPIAQRDEWVCLAGQRTG